MCLFSEVSIPSSQKLSAYSSPVSFEQKPSATGIQFFWLGFRVSAPSPNFYNLSNFWLCPFWQLFHSVIILNFSLLFWPLRGPVLSYGLPQRLLSLCFNFRWSKLSPLLIFHGLSSSFSWPCEQHPLKCSNPQSWKKTKPWSVPACYSQYTLSSLTSKSIPYFDQ